MMTTQAEAIIYLADQRSCSQSHWYRSYQTFKQNKFPSGSLRFLNDDVLRAGFTYKYIFKEDTLVMLMPVAGGLSYAHNNQSDFIEVGECRMLFIRKDETLAISNTYESELINYLCAGWSTGNQVYPDSHLVKFDQDDRLNELIPVHLLMSIGKFNSREESIYKTKDAQKGVMVFVLEGAFEVQNRLLHPRDGLALWNINEVEFEALSENATLLFLEAEL